MGWIKENLAVFTALVAAFSALFGAVIAAGAKFIFDFYLSEKIKRRWDVIRVKRQYSAPIIRAMEDLASRIENLDRQLPTRTKDAWFKPFDAKSRSKIPFAAHAHISTIFLFVRVIAWIEVLKREQLFLDFTSARETREFNAYLQLVYTVISSPSGGTNYVDRSHLDYWIFYNNLSGIGEAALQRDNDRLRCLTFQEFCNKFRAPDDANFLAWMNEVDRLIVNLSKDPTDRRWDRLQILWYCLDRFLDFVDPKRLRTTRDRSRSLDIPSRLKKEATEQANRLGLSLN